MPHANTEDQVVEMPAIGLFAELGWETVRVTEEVLGAGGALGRETSGELGAGFPYTGDFGTVECEPHGP